MNTRITFLIAFCMLLGDLGSVHAHDGRRLDIVVVDNQLFAQGYNSGDDDGAPATRPYFNVIHDHFTNVTPAGGGVLSARAELPGFGISQADTLQVLNGHKVDLALTGARKWVRPETTAMPDENTSFADLAELTALDGVISVVFGRVLLKSDAANDPLTVFTLAGSISSDTPEVDLDLAYFMDIHPENTLYVLQWELSTSNRNIANSESVYTILSPAGANPVEKLHQQALAMERSLGIQVTSVPEPGSLVWLTLAGVLATGRRRRV